MNYILMHKNTPVLELNIDEAQGAILAIGEMYNAAHLPIGISVFRNHADKDQLINWWNSRAIPASRSGLRRLLETLKIPRIQTLIKECYGLSLSDQYWICPTDKPLKWDDINFFDNQFSEDMGNLLLGGPADPDKINLISPDSTSDGWLKKRWKIIDGKRCLVKGGSAPFYQEPLNEVVASLICERLNIPHISYSVVWDDGLPYSVCEDFIDGGHDLVSAFHICETKPFQKGDDLYLHYLDCCRDLGIEDVAESLNRMMVLDFLIANTDRHFGNFGAIRNAETLKWVGTAPMFDNGTSLWCNAVNTLIDPNADTKSSTFSKTHQEQLKLVMSFDWLDLSGLSGIEDKMLEIFSNNPFVDVQRRDLLCSAVKQRIEMLDDYVR